MGFFLLAAPGPLSILFGNKITISKDTVSLSSISYPIFSCTKYCHYFILTVLDLLITWITKWAINLSINPDNLAATAVTSPPFSSTGSCWFMITKCDFLVSRKVSIREFLKKLVRQRSYWRRSGKYVQRRVCFVNIQSSLHENVIFSACACLGGQCSEDHIYYVEFHFPFRLLVSFLA